MKTPKEKAMKHLGFNGYKFKDVVEEAIDIAIAETKKEYEKHEERLNHQIGYNEKLEQQISQFKKENERMKKLLKLKQEKTTKCQ